MRLARALNALVQDDGHEVVHLRDKFPSDIADHEWIGALAADGDWIVISADVRIIKNPVNLEAWRSSQLSGFFLKKGWSQLKLWDQAHRLIRFWPSIMAVASRVEAGAVFLVPTAFRGKGLLESVKSL